MLVSHQERPRELKWYHAGPLLYGDLGTSRFYVLGLAFYYALYSSFWYVLGVGVLVAAVGWAYTIVCRAYPDGGGVYSAARQLSPMLSVIGALLLFADYAVTAALSSFEGLHYFGVEADFWVKAGAIAAIVFLGIINFIGPKKAGSLALLIAMATMVATLVLVGFSVPHLGEGWRHVQSPSGDMAQQWKTLADVVLALSGVEAVANMTGIMVHPVEKTARRSIWPVLGEVILFNLILGVAMLSLQPSGAIKSNGRGDFDQPAHEYEMQARAVENRVAETKALMRQHLATAEDVTREEQRLASVPRASEHEQDIKNKVLRVMGEQFVGQAMGARAGRIWGAISGFIFGLLLLSAVNTVLGGMISVQYVMARDGELPVFFNRLNVFGVPWIGLIPAVGIPVVLLMMFARLEDLADLYAIGVVGAIAINLTSCTINTKLTIRRWERMLMGLIALIMGAIELTLAVQKVHALIFVLLIVGSGLGFRYVTRNYPRWRARFRPVVPRLPQVETPAGPALAPIETLATPAEQLDMAKPHIMVATRGGQRLIEFAANYARRAGGILFVIYVRQLNVPFVSESRGLALEEDREARHVLQAAAEVCRKAEVPMVPIYVVSPDVAYSILDFAATYNVESLLMGVSRKGTLLRALQGDVITNVADNLPGDIPLLIHA